jgi:hypothetical protein
VPIKLIANVCVFNEVKLGNLARCLDNLSQYCDEIIIYDDASTDNSVEIALKYTPHIIRGSKNDQMEELDHKRQLLEYSIGLGATHVFWLDCDEVLERRGVDGEIRALCENWPDGVDAYSFRELNLWRSQQWIRTDTLFAIGRFVRLWKVAPDIHFDVRRGVHKQLYPSTIYRIVEAPFGVIHYGFWNYKKMLVKIGAHGWDRGQMLTGSGGNWILNEQNCTCYKAPDEMFPKGCIPPDIWEEPKPRQAHELAIFPDVPDEKEWPVIDEKGLQEWGSLHSRMYHGSYEDILARNKVVWHSTYGGSELKRINLFHMDVKDKVVCDIGAGGGWFGLECLKKGAKKVYLMEIDQTLISHMEDSFTRLGVPKDQYEIINIGDNDLMQNIPIKFDIVYCMAVFMHIKFWQGQAWFNWISKNTQAGSEVHFQFYQTNKTTMFWNGLDSVTNIRMEHELEKVGLRIIDITPINEEGMVSDVWYIYKLIKGE